MNEPLREPTAEEIEAARANAPRAFRVGYHAGHADGMATRAGQVARLEADLTLARDVLRHLETVRQTSGTESMTGWALNFLRRTRWYREALDSLLEGVEDTAPDRRGT